MLVLFIASPPPLWAPRAAVPGRGAPGRGPGPGAPLSGRRLGRRIDAGAGQDVVVRFVHVLFCLAERAAVIEDCIKQLYRAVEIVAADLKHVIGHGLISSVFGCGPGRRCQAADWTRSRTRSFSTRT